MTENTDQPEQLWITQALQGERDAITRLVEAYQDVVFNVCYRLLGEAGEAEDVAQEAFFKMYTNLRSYDRQRPFKTWLLAIASHGCIDRLRQRRLTWLALEEEGLPPRDWPALHAPEPGPEDALAAREREAYVQAMLARLAPEDRTVLVLHYWHDLSYDEIASSTGSSVSAVKSRLFRARRELARTMPQAEVAL